jgi:hypothetical protein
VGETAQQIETHIRDTRDDLSANLSELELKMKSVTDWRQQYQKHPGTFLAVAAGAGLLLALLMRGRRSIVVPVPMAPEAATPPTPRPKGSGQVEHSIGAIKSALIGVAASKAMGALSKLVAGLEDQLPAGAKNEYTAERRTDVDPPLAH